MSEQRERILSEACELYLTHGLDGFSMRKLASAVGVTAPALYKYFESKEAVLLAVLEEGYNLLAGSLYGALGGASPAERFRMAGRAHLDFALEHTRYYELIYTHPKLLGIDELPAEIEAKGCAIHQFFMDRVRECMDSGVLRPEDPEEASITMWAHAHGLLSLYLGGMLTEPDGTPFSEEVFREKYLESGLRLMRGMATAEGVADLEQSIGAAMELAEGAGV